MINVILNLLRSDGYVTVHKTLIKNIGLVPAVLFAELCSKYKYFSDDNSLKDGYFYYTLPDCEKELGLSRREQDGAFKVLESLGLIEKKAKKFANDSAPKRYIKITENYNLIISLLKEVDDKKPESKNVDNIGIVQNEQIELHEMNKSNCTKRTSNKNKEIRLNNNKKNKSVSQSVYESKNSESVDQEKLTNELTNIFQKAQVEIYNDPAFKETLKEVITDAFFVPDTRDIIKKLKLEHIDHAIFKYREAMEQKQIKNPKLYFSKTLLSAINESGLNDLLTS